MNIQEYNSAAWDGEAERGIEWCLPVGPEVIARARAGHWELKLTPLKNIPREWFPEDLNGIDVLCLASGGGQQSPVFAAAGAIVTSFDNSGKQLELDQLVADREGLQIRIEKGDAADLSRFEDGSFDLIFNPVSNLFFPDLGPVWREAFRVLRPGGSMFSGFMNPLMFMFENGGEAAETLVVNYPLPYSDIDSLPPEKLREKKAENLPMEFSHTLEDQIGGQLAAGFLITGFYEDRWRDDATTLNKFTPTSAAVKAVKPPLS